jgi:hypothetical protein
MQDLCNRDAPGAARVLKHLAAAAAGAAVALLSGQSAHAYDALMKQPCSITDRGRPPLHIEECLIKSSMSQGAALVIVTTPDGRRFRIENDPNDIDKWRLNGRRAKQTNGGTCYESSQVAVCSRKRRLLKTDRSAMRGRGESYSDVILRLVELEARGPVSSR